MRKKTVLKSEPCPPPENTTIIKIKYYTYGNSEIRTIAKAQIIKISDGCTGEVLNIDLFRDGELKARYFADRDARSYRALIVETGEWKKLCLQNAANVIAGSPPNYAETHYYCAREAWEFDTDKDEDVVRKYLREDVRYWESDIQREKRYRALENKQERINMLMADVVPDIPEDFYRWAEGEMFGQQYLFQKKLASMTRLSCTACGKTWLKKKGMGIGTKICPKCGNEVLGTYKEKMTSAVKRLYLLQPCKIWGRWIERYFLACCTWSRERPKEKTLDLDERIRIIVPNGKDWGDIYYEDNFNKDGPTYWDSNRSSSKLSNGYLYPGTIHEMKKYWPETLAHSGIDILAGKGIKCNYNRMIITGHKEPAMEYLVKGGFYRLVTETLDYAWYNGSRKTDMKGKTPQEVLRLSPDRVNRFRQLNGGFKILGWLQYEQKMGKRISQENLLEMDRYGINCNDEDVWEILSYVKSPDMFANYIRKQAATQKMTRLQVIKDWADYLDMAQEQKLNLSHELFYKPKNLKAAHDACVRAAQYEELKGKAEGILKRFPDVERIMDSVREKYSYHGKDFCIVVPKDIIDIIHEGRALGHCIDTTDRYFDRIQHNITYLVFLRRAASRDIPYYTLEIEPGGTVRQQRTTGNSQNKEEVKEYAAFLKEWQGVVRERISEEDRKLAEVSRQTRIREYQELRDKQEKVWRGALAGKLLVDVLEADLIEAI